MSLEENKAVVRRWHDEFWGGKADLDRITEVLHPDYVRHPSMAGVEATKQWMAQMFSEYPDGQTIPEDTIAEGDKVVTRWRAEVGGKTIATGVSIHRIADGKIIEDWAWSQMLTEA
jgi:predicted SnoaL-like aldol condensation-catalyzing enzyme